MASRVGFSQRPEAIGITGISLPWLSRFRARNLCEDSASEYIVIGYRNHPNELVKYDYAFTPWETACDILSCPLSGSQDPCHRCRYHRIRLVEPRDGFGSRSSSSRLLSFHLTKPRFRPCQDINCHDSDRHNDRQHERFHRS